MEAKADILFEVSWEACNKVGGIYTVLMSKTKQMVEHYKENYYVIGPYFHDKALGEFDEEVPPEECKPAFGELKKLGINCHCGKWLVKGEPNVILIDFSGFTPKTNDIKKELWDNFRIDSLNAPGDFNEPVAWATAAGMVIEKLAKIHKGSKIVAQFHEWLAGAGLLYLKESKANVGTIFTTHATTLGRSIAAANVDLYGILGKIDPDKEAYNYSVAAKHQLEKQSAVNADVFTTVSEITGVEAEALLKRKPDVILANGLDLESFPSFEDASLKHRMFKFRIKEFILYDFFPYYQFDLDETLLFFTFARYEFQNKGLDVLIKALARLNEKMIESKSQRTVVMFFFIPTSVKGIKPELLENKRYYEDIKESVDEDIEAIRARILYSIVSQAKLVKETIFEPDFLADIKKKMLRFAKTGKKPGILTHDLAYDETRDAIIQALNKYDLKNNLNDKVKIVFYPTYLTGADGLLDLSYYEAIMGCHLGIFPSYYEPWGYTPLETAASGVAAVTSDLAGFGKYICRECTQGTTPGIWVLSRENKKEEEIVEGLFNILNQYTVFNKQMRIENKIEAHRLAMLADWKILIENYIQAQNIAAEKTVR